ncbi:long-chain-fatty-acid--CoA ligase [Halobacillus karajensis]|uniref:Long-chain-fatty-acid--CoA ligase n=1 Tax=Halobacillus karajensis TaxID=195088 RepID=A0A024P425_9BACI|nr:long-chain fatty acid--CoA ligase [Halobacillus karajensis]CDQ19051.1 Long-chain-fatty-acid--CoA ligase [Halobacillus karajensis]CDQ22875.1 Long-chain-fatty-acid--CoA ligase [Halobacillus karajensis]CDQ26357.1 Long-chain-fatty-acid--CoA ligase [Halobacillus karajensis]
MNQLVNRTWYEYYPPEMKKGISYPEVPLYQLLEHTAARYGSRAAIIYEETIITYEELKRKVDQLAGAWDHLGLLKGERIGLMVSNHPDYMIAYYAAQRLGLIVVQINPRYTARELLQIIDDADMNFLVVDKEQLSTVDQVKDMCELRQIFVANDGERETRSITHLIHQASPLEREIPISVKEDVAVIQYTGGTTGKMKGAMLTHFNLVANVVQSHAMYGEKMEKGKEVILTATPLYHVYAMTSAMNLGIYIGATILLIRKFKVEDVLDRVKRFRPTFFPGVPGMYNAFVNHPDVESYNLDCLKFCSSGSAPLPVEIIKQFEAMTGAVIGEGFGLTEASPSTHRNPTFGVRKVGSIGIPLPGTDSKIVNEENQELPENSVGELIIKGPQVMKGYWKKDEETRHALRNGWLYTGDLAMTDEDGYFYIVGRKKEMIINGGFNIYPQEIESVLYEHPDVKESAVVGIPNHEKGEIVKAYIVAKDGHTIDVEELKGHCYRNLTRYKVPKQFEITKDLPRNTVGKLLKRKLIETEKQKGG